MVESWALLGDDLWPVNPVESFLPYLTAIERSPNTVKACARDLKDGRGLDWKVVDLEAVAAFVARLRLPPTARYGVIAVLPAGEHPASRAEALAACLLMRHLFCSFPSTRKALHG
ncbi:hypothetical protein [Streptomyces sp. NPDC051001]|uniref:hypothetical protein n=1 Tax=Streptomyces sp. NPDC051001 TaxID=3155795 RepID=UPI0034422A88